jgi:hypothetical protein
VFGTDIPLRSPNPTAGTDSERERYFSVECYGFVVLFDRPDVAVAVHTLRFD